MTEETVITAYERLVQGRRTFGAKAEETIQSKDNNEKFPSMVMEDVPKRSLWNDDGSMKSLNSDDDEEETGHVKADIPVFDSSLTMEHTMQTEDDDKATDGLETKDSDNEVEDLAADLSDDEAEFDDLSGNDTENKLDTRKENVTNEHEEAEDAHVSQIPSSPHTSEKRSNSPMTNSSPNLDEEASKGNENTLVDEESPSIESLLEATNKLFDQVQDKGSVTVKEILLQLGVPLDKPTKKEIRQRLVDLITAWQHQQEGGDESSKESSSEEEEEANEEDAMDEEDIFGDADEDDDDGYEPDAAKPRVVKSRQTRGLARERPNRKKLNKSLQKSAMRIHAEQLRKKRMNELRVRNEELEYESKDQERAEQIAAKFETQTDDQLRERLSNRVHLWQKLDQKRWNVLQAKSNVNLEPMETAEAVQMEIEPTDEIAKVDLDNVDSSSGGDDDSDDDLEITGDTKMLMTARSSPKPARTDVLSLLELSSPKLSLHRKEPAISPNRCLATLKRQLKSKHQKMGNLWLAQELGYKTEQEHIHDCVQLEERKRTLQVAREQERLKESEVRQERLLQLGIVDEDEEEQLNQPESENHDENGDRDKSDDEGEEDEEIAMAREMGVIESDTVDVSGSIRPNDNVENLDEASSLENSCDVPVDNDLVPRTIVEETNTRNQVDDNVQNEIQSDSGESGVKTTDDIIVDENAAVVPPVDDENNDDNGSEKNSDLDGEDETEFDDKLADPAKSKGPRNSAWKAMLQRDDERMKKLKKRGKGGFVEEEAEEEEEEEVAGLEDFGFTIRKKKNDDDDEEGNVPDDDDEMDDVVDELSDNEGDEDAGEKARREEQKREEKERHKDILRRMRNGYDGRRGGIAGGSARGIHRFDQLVAADNREDAKRLGLLNDDELDSEGEGEKKEVDEDDEDENALLDKMLKDRFLHRSSVEVEEDFSGDEIDEIEDKGDGNEMNKQTEEEREQETLAKRFSKRARMQRLIDAHGHDEEFSRSKLIDDDAMIKADLQKMKNGLARKRSISSVSTASRASSGSARGKQQKTGIFGGVFQAGGSLAIALQANRRSQNRTSFVRTGAATSSETRIHQQNNSISFNHVVFRASENGQSRSNLSTSNKLVQGRRVTPPPPISKTGSSLWSKSVVTGFQKKR